MEYRSRDSAGGGSTTAVARNSAVTARESGVACVLAVENATASVLREGGRSWLHRFWPIAVAYHEIMLRNGQENRINTTALQNKAIEFSLRGLVESVTSEEAVSI